MSPCMYVSMHVSNSACLYLNKYLVYAYVYVISSQLCYFNYELWFSIYILRVIVYILLSRCTPTKLCHLVTFHPLRKWFDRLLKNYTESQFLPSGEQLSWYTDHNFSHEVVTHTNMQNTALRIILLLILFLIGIWGLYYCLY